MMANREPNEAMRSGAAQVVAQALGMNDAAEELARELHVVARDDRDATYAIELLAGGDSAAFLVYGFDLAHADADGRDGETRLRAALATLDTAARLDAPGPRVVAHAFDERFGYVLATTPEFLRRMAGNPASAEPGPMLTAEERRLRRAEAAEQLAVHLRGAERAATIWLEAVGEEEAGRLTEEAELALHLLEPGHLDALTQAIRRLIDVARPERA